MAMLSFFNVMKSLVLPTASLGWVILSEVKDVSVNEQLSTFKDE